MSVEGYIEGEDVPGYIEGEDVQKETGKRGSNLLASSPVQLRMKRSLQKGTAMRRRSSLQHNYHTDTTLLSESKRVALAFRYW